MWYWMYFNDDNTYIVPRIKKGKAWFISKFGFDPQYAILNPAQKCPVSHLVSLGIYVLRNKCIPINNIAFTTDEWMEVE